MRVEITVYTDDDRMYRSEIECSQDIGYEILMNMARNNIQELHEWANPQKSAGNSRPRPIKDQPQA